MIRYLRIITILILAAIAAGQIDAQTSTNLRRQRNQAEQKAKAAEKRLEANRKALRANLNELSSLQADISRLDDELAELKATAASLSQQIAPLADSITFYSGRLTAMRDAYARVLRKTYRNNTNLDELSFVFASSSFTEACRRLQSLKQFAKWRTRKADEIKTVTRMLEAKKLRLDSLSQANAKVITRSEASRKQLEAKRRETDQLVRQLEASSAELEREVARRNSEMEALDAKIDEAVAAEMRRQEDERKRAEVQKREAERREAEKPAPGKSAESVSDKNAADKPAAPAPKASGQDAPAKIEKSDSPAPAAKSVPMTADEQKRLTEQFVAAKGKLPAPFKGSGKIVKKFGKQKHPRLANVTTDNAGIDIETGRGAEVTAVFDGEVSHIFKLAGYNNVIVIRHGDYLTVYANLVDLKVAKGDQVKRGTALGRVYTDTTDSNRSVLHFELRHEKEKQDPELWLKKL